MARFTAAQLQQAYQRAGFQGQAGATDAANARKYGLKVFGREQAKRQKAAGAPTTPTTSSPEDVTKSFVDQIRDLLKPAGPQADVTPFDQSGFYKEEDTRALANQEYDPYYQRLAEYQGANTAEGDRQRLEDVNASGGSRSSAYQKELELRRLALTRSDEERRNQQRADKEGFVTNRRNDAFRRYQQSLGNVNA
jgi:hypothetical protein